MDRKINELRSLPIEEFKKRFSEMYDSANDGERDEIIRSFKKNTEEHILKVDSFIEETMKIMKHNEARRSNLFDFSEFFTS